MTETSPILTMNPYYGKKKVGTVGIPVPDTDLRLVDIETGEQVELGKPGEIICRGPQVTRGYYKKPDANAKTIIDGWLHTGDLGYMDEDGFVFVTGRIKEIMIKGGENISPREIDEVLYKHSMVQDAAAVGIPDEHYGEEIMCCVVLKPGCTVTEQELRDHCLEHLGEFKTPKVIKLIADLPNGPSGKIQRLKLREMV